MKSSLTKSIVLLIALLLGWCLGYLRIPFGGIGSEFWFGAMAMLGVCSMLVLFLSGQRRRGNISFGSSRLFITIAFVFLLVSLAWLWAQKVQLEQALLTQQEVIDLQHDSLQRSQNEQQINRLHALLQQADQELANSPNRQLSSSLIEQLILLSQALKPYNVLESLDTIRTLSPERGFLLQSLLAMKMDSVSWGKIISQSNFEGADLRDANLSFVRLSNSRLAGADLSYATLDGANLNYANLSHANLRGAKMKMVQLNRVNLHRAQAQWAELQSANIQESNLGGANFSHANLRDANLTATLCKWSFWRGAILRGAILEKVDFLGSKLMKADLSGADLSWASLSRTEIKDANLREAKLDHVAIHLENWLQQLGEWNIEGNEKLVEWYEVVEKRSIQSQYRLQRKK